MMTGAKELSMGSQMTWHGPCMDNCLLTLDPMAFLGSVIRSVPISMKTGPYPSQVVKKNRRTRIRIRARTRTDADTDTDTGTERRGEVRGEV